MRLSKNRYQLKNQIPILSEKPINFRKEAMNMLAEAQELFEKNQHKDAYAKASEALRFYYMHKLKSKKELTSTETFRLLKSNNMDHNNAQKCLNLCGLVEFARYKPNKRDFNQILSLAREEIK